MSSMAYTRRMLHRCSSVCDSVLTCMCIARQHMEGLATHMRQETSQPSTELQFITACTAAVASSQQNFTAVFCQCSASVLSGLHADIMQGHRTLCQALSCALQHIAQSSCLCIQVVRALTDLKIIVSKGDDLSLRRAITYFLNNIAKQTQEQETIAAIGEDMFAVALDQPFRYTLLWHTH